MRRNGLAVLVLSNTVTLVISSLVTLAITGWLQQPEVTNILAQSPRHASSSAKGVNDNVGGEPTHVKSEAVERYVESLRLGLMALHNDEGTLERMLSRSGKKCEASVVPSGDNWLVSFREISALDSMQVRVYKNGKTEVLVQY